MKKIVLLLAIMVFATVAQAQTSAVYSFGDSAKQCVGDAGLIDVDGNYVMMGRRGNVGNLYAKFDANHSLLWSFVTPSSMSVQGWRMFQTANKDYIGVLATGFSGFIIRISPNGTILWNRTLGQITSLRDGFEDANGDLYFVGGWGNRNIVMRLDAYGNEIWAKKITNGRSTNIGTTINPTADGNLMIGGLTQNAGTTPLDFALCKVSKTGSLIWGNTYSTPSLNINLTDIEISSQDQSIIIAGHSYSNVGAYDVNTKEAIVAKIDSAGNFVSFKSLGTTKEDQFTAITQIPSPSNPLFVLSGSSKTPAGATKLLLSSVDNAGNFVNIKTYGDNHGNGFFFDQINYDPTHGLNAMGTGSGFYVANASEYQFARFDTSLNLPCKSFTQSMAQNNFNLNKSGSYTISNHVLGYDSTAFTKVNDDLTAFNSCSGDTISNWPVATENIQQLEFKIYPNPVFGLLNIDFGGALLNQLVVRDLNGRVIYTSDNAVARVQIETHEWVSGVYLIEANMQNGQRLVRKLMVQ